MEVSCVKPRWFDVQRQRIESNSSESLGQNLRKGSVLNRGTVAIEMRRNERS